MDVSVLVKESLGIQGGEFIETVSKATDLLRGESGKIEKMTMEDRLVRLKPKGEAVVIGDLHGDLKSLTTILENSNVVSKMASDKEEVIIFLGDYGDRGAYPAEVYYIVLQLKLVFPEQVALLRGNHEGPEDLMASPHDLPLQFQARFKQNYRAAYSKVRELFGYLYNAVLVEESYLLVHGGLSPEIANAQDLAHAHRKHPERAFLEDLLWSDPHDRVQDVLHSPRGAGKLFGKNVTETVLRKLGVNVLIRGHEPCAEGFKLNHDGKVLTLFSRKGAPYFNAHGAYLQLPLSEKFQSAQELVPWIHKF